MIRTEQVPLKLLPACLSSSNLDLTLTLDNDGLVLSHFPIGGTHPPCSNPVVALHAHRNCRLLVIILSVILAALSILIFIIITVSALQAVELRLQLLM